MALNRLQRTGYAWFGDLAKKQDIAMTHLRRKVPQAGMKIRPEVHLAFAMLNGLIGAVVAGIPVALLVAGQILGLWAIAPLILVVALILPVALGGTLYVATILYPSLRAGNRARNIEARLPYALNYLGTMAQAGLTPTRMFRGLADQPIYEEVADEAWLIVRDMELFGDDLVTSFNRAADRTPSESLQDVLHGAVATLTSGGDLKSYFMSKSDQYMERNRQRQQRFLDDLGILAESFVVVVVAAPLFMLVLFTVTAVFGGGGNLSLETGYLLILVLLPLSHMGFAVAIKSSTPEV